MKKVIFILLTTLLVIPSSIKADIKSEGLIESLEKENIEVKCPDYKETDKQAKIYLFKQYGESKSLDLLNYLNDLCEEYGEFFKLISYEVTENTDNNILFANTLEYLNSETSSVPFMVVGDSYFITFNDNNKDTLLKSFLRLYQIEDKNKPDKMEEVFTKYYRNTPLILSVLFVIIFLVIGLVIIARINNNEKEKVTRKN